MEKSNLNVISVIKVIPGKIIYCFINPQAFQLKIILDKYVEIHSGETPYRSRIIDKASQLKISLDIQNCLHTGDKPYRCRICDKDF